jgi:hypothetical protein
LATGDHDPDKADLVRKTVIQAWNCAVEDTLAPEQMAGDMQGSAVLLRPAPPLALYRSTADNGLINAERADDLGESFGRRFLRRLLRVPVDPLQLSWNEIHNIVQRDDVFALRQRYQQQVNHGHPEGPETFSQLLGLVGQHALPDRSRTLGTFVIQNGSWAGGGAIGFLLGGPPGAAIAGLLGVTIPEGTVRARDWARRLLVVNTLRHQASELLPAGDDRKDEAGRK